MYDSRFYENDTYKLRILSLGLVYILQTTKTATYARNVAVEKANRIRFNTATYCQGLLSLTVSCMWDGGKKGKKNDLGESFGRKPLTTEGIVCYKSFLEL